MKRILTVAVLMAGFSGAAFSAACPDTSSGATIAAGSATTPTTGEACVCDGGAAIKNTVNGGSGAVVTTPIFVKNGFDVQCSSNTLVSYNEISGTAFAVASGSKKGNQTFIGTSNGGSVTTDQKCSGTNDACTGGNVTSAMGRAVTAASGS